MDMGNNAKHPMRGVRIDILRNILEALMRCDKRESIDEAPRILNDAFPRASFALHKFPNNYRKISGVFPWDDGETYWVPEICIEQCHAIEDAQFEVIDMIRRSRRARPCKIR